MPDNKTNDTQPVDYVDVRQITDVEAKTMSENFSKMAQIALNIVNRQIAHNFGLFSLYNKTSSVDTAKPNLLNGISSRVAYNSLVTYPILHIRKELEEKEASKFQINFAAAGIDTFIGVPLELNGSIKTMQKLGVNVEKTDLLKMTSKSFVPFLFRNLLVWSEINKESQGMPNDIARAGVVGAFSSPLHNIGIKMAESFNEKTILEAMNKTKNYFLENPSRLSSGIQSRAIATMAAKILLSPQTTEFFTNVVLDIFSNNNDKPSNSPSPTKEVVKTVDKSIGR